MARRCLSVHEVHDKMRRWTVLVQVVEKSHVLTSNGSPPIRFQRLVLTDSEIIKARRKASIILSRHTLLRNQFTFQWPSQLQKRMKKIPDLQATVLQPAKKDEFFSPSTKKLLDAIAESSTTANEVPPTVTTAKRALVFGTVPPGIGLNSAEANTPTGPAMHLEVP